MDEGSFPSTIWSQVRRGGARADGREQGLEALARRYQAPAESYLRAALRLSREDAHELFQEFFAWMLASDFLAKAEPGRGRFRGFLKVALRRFATDERRRARAQKRGGGRASVPLDGGDAGEPVDPSARAPDELLDEAWRAELVQEAFARTRADLARQGRDVVFAVFHDYYLAPGPEPDYRALAARHGLSSAEVSNDLQRAKKAFRQHLRALVLDTVADAADLGSELAWLVAEETSP